METDTKRPPLADTDEVAEFLGVPSATLVQWRYLGKGPAWRKIGKYVRYDWPSVEQWLADQPGGGGTAPTEQ